MKTLLGIGGSEDSLYALKKAIRRAKQAGDDLTIAIVENPEAEPTQTEIRDRIAEELSAAEFDAEITTLSGHPGSELVDLAERGSFDRIVLGGGETSPLGKVKLGEIAEFVLLNARTTVTLIR
ncbi:universal stress protein [Natronomonas sp. F2-12]|jgi:nucleotide-binding universal stress UspA family protein|uniref:Universal stress protein n=1 Tax=Natronomonas aquatica TaxID=2841590 RepID=A0A9R1CUI6_9EURY|nr:universal stress protein [Natronomonas aquatica]MCQ4334038.1 universal stress protein [Natronomonas aquatica]